MPRRTQDPARVPPTFDYRACTSYGRPFNAVRLVFDNRLFAVLLPQSVDWFGLFRFRSPLLSESLLFSFPPGTEMFQFPGLLSHGLCIQPWMTYHYVCRVPPFGYPRIVAFVPLPVAFRRLMRPSSAASG